MANLRRKCRVNCRLRQHCHIGRRARISSFPRAVLFLRAEKSKKGVEGRTKRIGSEDRADLIKRFSGSRAGVPSRPKAPFTNFSFWFTVRGDDEERGQRCTRVFVSTADPTKSMTS